MTATPTAQSGPSDQAIAQAFREAQGRLNPSHITPSSQLLLTINQRAGEIGAQPLEKAREVTVNAAHLAAVLSCAEPNHFDDSMADADTTITQACIRMRNAIATPPIAQQGNGEATAWRIRIGDSDVWSYCDNETDADLLGKSSGMKYEKQPVPPPSASQVAADEFPLHLREHVQVLRCRLANDELGWRALLPIMEAIASKADGGCERCDGSGTVYTDTNFQDCPSCQTTPAASGLESRHMRHIGGGLLALYIGDEQTREIGVTPGWDFKDRDEVIIRYNEYEALAAQPAPGVGGDVAARLYNVLKALDERGHTDATWDNAKRVMADYEAATRPAESVAQGGEELPDDATNLEVIEFFIRVGRTMKPVGHWPGERLYAAIERALNTPHRFIAEADRSPRRAHNGRGGDEEQALRPFTPTPTPTPATGSGGEAK